VKIGAGKTLLSRKPAEDRRRTHFPTFDIPSSRFPPEMPRTRTQPEAPAPS
jgi:hypothetical protein